jgi:Flp pilus assembly protein CpaB
MSPEGVEYVSVAEAQKRRKVLIALVAALVAAGVFVFGLNTVSKGYGAPTMGQPVVAMTSVVAVNADLPVQTKIVATDLRTVEFPTAQLTSDNVTTMAEAVGKVNVVPLSAGTILLTSELQSDFVNELSLKLDPGDVAVAIPFDESKGFGGFIQPEDRFDILCDSGNNLPAYYCFTDVRVL